MPELPEVETVARDLDVQITGATVTQITHLDWPRLIEGLDPAGFELALTGRRVERVWRRAKWLLVSLDNGNTLAVHLRMSGSLWVPGAEEPRDAHVRLELALADGRTLRFRDVRKFGRMRLLDPAALAALEASFGPEPLAAGFSTAWLQAALKARTTRLKPLLLDQRFVAGLGNIYVDEALWRARLHPERPATSLRPGEATALHEAIQAVLTAAITRRGSTLRDYRTGTGAVGENQHHFQAYGRTDAPCPRCATPIVRSEVAQRGTHHCPTCQVLSPARRSPRKRGNPS